MGDEGRGGEGKRRFMIFIRLFECEVVMVIIIMSFIDNILRYFVVMCV